MADKTPASRTERPPGEESGLAKADDTIENEVPVATEDDVIALLKQMDTEILQAAIVEPGRRMRLPMRSKLDFTSRPAKVRELSEARLNELASSVFWARFARIKTIKDELKEASRQYDAVYGGDAWRAEFATAGSGNEQYERWLDSGNARGTLPGGAYFSIIRPESGVNRPRLSSAYDLAAGPGHSHGAVLLSIKDGCLRAWCELADQLEVAAVVFVQHIMIRERATESPTCLDSTWPKLSNQGVELNGVAIKTGDEQAKIRFEVPSFLFADATQDALDQARVRMTCLRSRSCFVVMVTEATRPLPGPGIRLGLHFPLYPSVDIGSSNFMYSVNGLFGDTLNVRRLWSVPDTWTQYQKESALGWLLMVSAFINETSALAGTIQRLDYEVVTRSSVAALADIKNLRARVARLRADMDQSSHMFRFVCADTARFPGLENGSRESEDPSIHVAPTERALVASVSYVSEYAWMDEQAAARALASVSYASEYAWMDKQAAALMVPLNQALQLVVAQISIEQAQQSTKQTAAANKLAQRSYELSSIMATDSAIGIKNGERSTQLTLLAAIYLPLTLATGIFGMNIAEINGGTPRFWWVIIVAALHLIPSAIFIAYILWTSRRDNRKQEKTD